MATEAWIVPTIANMEDALAARAIDAFRTKALATGQSDPFPAIAQQVANRIRSEIQQHNTLSATPYAIPKSLMWIAVPLILESMAARLPGTESLLSGYEKILADARDFLRRINADRIQVEAPLDPEASELFQAESAFTVVTSEPRVATRELLAGL